MRDQAAAPVDEAGERLRRVVVEIQVHGAVLGFRDVDHPRRLRSRQEVGRRRSREGRQGIAVVRDRGREIPDLAVRVGRHVDKCRVGEEADGGEVVVLEGDGRDGGLAEHAAGEVAEMEGERFGQLAQRIVDERDFDLPGRLAGREDPRPGDGRVVGAGRGGAVFGPVGHRKREVRASAARHVDAGHAIRLREVER